MMAFTEMELAALRSIFSESPDLTSDLERQLTAAVVTKRENSGAGFFTSIAVPGDAPRVSSPRALGYETHARVLPLEHGLGFVLFMENGALDLLEGFACGQESTAALDFAKLDFEVFRAPVQRIG